MSEIRGPVTGPIVGVIAFGHTQGQGDLHVWKRPSMSF